jgi:hypothetical protein
MTEQEWLTYSDYEQMLHFLLGSGLTRFLSKVTGVMYWQRPQRKLRLLMCAALRDYGLVGCGYEAVQAAERYADGQATWSELRRARQYSEFVANGGLTKGRYRLPEFDPLEMLPAYAARPDLTGEVYEVFEQTTWASSTKKGGQCDLIREIYGNPFHPVVLPEACRGWEGGAAVKLAEGIYAERRWQELPILADALEEAGCAEPELLAHLRRPGGHWHGCWALDAVLDRK